MCYRGKLKCENKQQTALVEAEHYLQEEKMKTDVKSYFKQTKVNSDGQKETEPDTDIL